MKNEFLKRSNSVFFICNILIPVSIGAYVYIYWDSNSYFGNFMRSFLTIPKVALDSNVLRFMRNWGCDFLFAYALVFALYVSTKNISVSIRYTAMCSIGLELLQLIQVDFLKCGTFDVVDIVIEIIAICFGATILSCYNHIKSKNRRE